MPQIVQKLLCYAIALPVTSPSGHQQKENLPPQREMQVLLPSIALGPAQRGAGVPEAVRE